MSRPSTTDTTILVLGVAILLAATHQSDTNEWLALLWIWVLHLIPAVILSAPIVYFAGNHVRWNAVDLMVFLLPFSLWSVLMFSTASSGKSLGNLIEPVLFTPAIPLAAAIREFMGPRDDEKVWTTVLLAFVCLAAVGVLLGTPPLPE
ncbi:hypothetical protein ACYOEI_18230 [Singulisphaera rosea]